MTRGYRHEEAGSTDSRGAGSPEHRWLWAVRRQREGPAAGHYKRLSRDFGELAIVLLPLFLCWLGTLIRQEMTE